MRHIFIDKYLVRWVVCSGIDKNFVDCGAFACGLALDLLVCGIGAAFCGEDVMSRL